jgi:hypothetical protein
MERNGTPYQPTKMIFNKPTEYERMNKTLDPLQFIESLEYGSTTVARSQNSIDRELASRYSNLQKAIGNCQDPEKLKNLVALSTFYERIDEYCTLSNTQIEYLSNGIRNMVNVYFDELINGGEKNKLIKNQELKIDRLAMERDFIKSMYFDLVARNKPTVKI